RTGTLVRLAIRARPELAKVPCPPYMDAPVLPSTHFMLDRGSRLHPYIRTRLPRQRRSLMGSAGWCLNRTSALLSAWGTSGLTNHGLTYLAIMSCLAEQSGEGLIVAFKGKLSPA